MRQYIGCLAALALVGAPIPSQANVHMLYEDPGPDSLELTTMNIVYFFCTSQAVNETAEYESNAVSLTGPVSYLVMDVFGKAHLVSRQEYGQSRFNNCVVTLFARPSQDARDDMRTYR